MLWPLLDAQLWIIDDHEIVLFSHLLKSHGGLSLDSFAVVLGHTELLGFDSGRYRPVYYTLRVLKSAWFGGNAALWFSFNAAFLTLSFVIVGACLRRYFGWFWVVTGMIALAALPFHAGLWGRLGPSEIDSFLWCALVLLGVLWHSNKCRWAWPLFCIASALAIGCKENFILFLIPMVWLLWVDWRRQSLKPSQFIWLIIPLMVSIPVSVVLSKAVFTSGTDIYGVSTGGGAVKSAGFFLVASGGAYFSYILLAALIFFRRKMPNDDAVRNALEAWGVIFLMLLGNYAFYRGDVGGLNRYGVPYHALLLLEFFIVLFVLKVPLSQIFIHRECRALFVRSSVVAVCVLGVVLALVGLSLNAMRVASQVRNTEIFADFLRTARNYDSIGVVTTGSASDWTYETLVSLGRYRDAGYIPEVFYLPGFSIEERQGIITGKDYFRQLSHDNLPRDLGAETLLIEFGPPNKKAYLGSFWGKITYFIHPWTNPHWFRIIEHSRPVRSMAKVLADRPFLPLTEQGDAVFRNSVTLYIPADNPAPGVLWLQTSVGLPQEHCWRFTLNGREVSPHMGPRGLEIPVTMDMWATAPHHPQVLELGMKCVDTPRQTPVPLRLTALVLDEASP